MAIEVKVKKAGRAGWIKKCLPLLFVFVLLAGGGCAPETTAPDRLRDINADLQESVTRLLIAADRLEQMERDLAYIDAAFDNQMTAHNVRSSVLEVINSIVDNRDELSEIADELE